MHWDADIRYMVAHNGREFGPLTLRELANRRLTSDMLVWHEGVVDWVPIADVPELQPYVRAAAVSTIAPPPPGGGSVNASYGRGMEFVFPPVTKAPPKEPSSSTSALIIGIVNLCTAALATCVLAPLNVLGYFAFIDGPQPSATIKLVGIILLAVWGLLTLIQFLSGVGLLLQRRWGRVLGIIYAYGALTGTLASTILWLDQIVVPFWKIIEDIPPAEQTGLLVGMVIRGVLIILTVAALLTEIVFLYRRAMIDRLR